MEETWTLPLQFKILTHLRKSEFSPSHWPCGLLNLETSRPNNVATFIIPKDHNLLIFGFWDSTLQPQKGSQRKPLTQSQDPHMSIIYNLKQSTSPLHPTITLLKCELTTYRENTLMDISRFSTNKSFLQRWDDTLSNSFNYYHGPQQLHDFDDFDDVSWHFSPWDFRAFIFILTIVVLVLVTTYFRVVIYCLPKCFKRSVFLRCISHFY